LRAAPLGSRFKLVTTPTETCPICGGTGWQTIERGKEREAVRCECRVRDRGERLLEAARIPARYQHCTLQSFKYDAKDDHPKSICHARSMAAGFFKNYPLEKTGLLLIGPCGVGKTHLAVGVIKWLMEDKGIQCLFTDYRELLKSIQNSYNPTVQVTEMDILRPVFDVEVLVLDELGAVRSSEWVFDTVNYILNSRYNAKRTTIVTTNFPDGPEDSNFEPNNLLSPTAAEKAARRETLGDRIGERMRSRLHEMCKIVSITGKDYRITANGVP
jgi:DNA replication protein DnaC